MGEADVQGYGVKQWVGRTQREVVSEPMTNLGDTWAGWDYSGRLMGECRRERVTVRLQVRPKTIRQSLLTQHGHERSARGTDGFRHINMDLKACQHLQL